MPTPSFQIDTVENSSIELSGQGIRISRGFTADYLNTAVDPQDLIMQVFALAGFPAIGDPHPTAAYADALVSNLIVQGSASDGVQGQVVYTKSEGGYTPSAYVVTRSTRLVDSIETILPNGTPLQCEFSVYGAHIPKDFIPMRFARPSSSYVVEGLRYGAPNYPGADYVGYVNDATFLGRAKGHLRIEEFTTQWSKYLGYHQFRCQLLGNILGRDWSTFGILYNSLVGKYVKVDPADIAASIADAYAYGLIGSTSTKGFLHVGGYPLVNFPSIGL